MSSSFASKLILNDALEPKYLQINFLYVLYVCDIGVMRQVGIWFALVCFLLYHYNTYIPTICWKGKQTKNEATQQSRWNPQADWNDDNELAMEIKSWLWKHEMVMKKRQRSWREGNCSKMYKLCYNRETSEKYNMGMNIMIWLWE